MKLFKSTLLAFALSFGITSLPAFDIAGQKVPDTAEVGGKTLVLNGAGKRVKVVFDVYVAALYTEAKSADASAIITAATPRRVELRMLRTVSATTMHESFTEGMKANIGNEGMQKFATQISALEKIFADAKSASKGDVIQIDLLPGQGTLLTIRGVTQPVIVGDDFGAAMLSIWLGAQPAQTSLKKKLLGE